jgi:glycosyltransferase involved in cell wall biosynthesis
MKIIVNTTNLKQGGGLQVAASILSELRNFPDNEYHVFLSPQISNEIAKDAFPGNFSFHQFDSNPTSSLKNILSFGKKLSAIENGIRPDMVLTVFGPALWKPKAPHLVGFANGLYLFDKMRFIQKVWLRDPLRRAMYYSRRSFLLSRLKREATIYWIETEYARNYLASELKVDPTDISVISNSYNESYSTFTAADHDRSTGRPFSFLYLTADYPHKNLDIFNELIPLVKTRKIDCRFYLTLPEEIFKKRFPKYVDDEVLVNLGPIRYNDGPSTYELADALFFPSLMETFSANYPEAMIMQKPIITSDLDFAHDICGDAALYFDPFSPTSIVETISYLVTHHVERADLVKKGLERVRSFDSAPQRAEKLLKVMKDYLNRNS